MRKLIAFRARGFGVACGLAHSVCLRNNELGGRGRRGSPEISHEVGDREVGLVADGRHHRHGGYSNGPGDSLLVKGPKILQGAAAATHDNDVRPCPLAEVPDSVDDFPGGSVALHANRKQSDMKSRKPPLDDSKHIGDDRSGGRRNETDATRHRGKLALAVRIEQPLGLQLGLETVEPHLQRAEPLWLERFDIELVLALLRVDADPPAGDDREAVRRLGRQEAR